MFWHLTPYLTLLKHQNGAIVVQCFIKLYQIICQIQILKRQTTERIEH